MRPAARVRHLAGAAVLLAAVLTPLTASATEPAGPPAPPPATLPSPCGTGGTFTASPPTCTYTGTGSDIFTAPAGVGSVAIALYGAEGGSAAGYVTPNPPNEGAPGGLGGETRATLAVSPGQTLRITVGAAGIPGSSRRGEYARPGGHGHGAGGGGAHGGGGSGGGASDVRTGAFGPADRVLVAGGGGGAGNGGPLLRGGHGGGLAGEPGGQGGGPEGSGVAGGGGTQDRPGSGSPNSRLGGPGIAGSDIDPNTGLPNPGSGGPGGNGSRGGNGGGGGGGGWFGGGGGSGGGNPDNLPGAGGGGGSGYAAPTATGVSLRPGVNPGNGRAVVTFRYGSSVRVVPDTVAPLFGHPVTFTATVDPGNPGAGTPTGTVEFRDGPVLLAEVPLEDGRARFRTGALRPGSHAITARFGGDPAFEPAATAEPAGVTVGFSRPCLTGPQAGSLTVAAGESLCLAAGATWTGPVRVKPGGALAVSQARITGPVSADGALALRFCGSAVTGPVGVQRTGGPVRIGAGADTPEGCAGNTLTGPVTLEGNTGGVELVAGRITGPLRCEANVPAPQLSGTTVTGPRSGQCRG
ncbi:hypothetical protein DEJ50_01805 [Streptomyces venezuelae]|uniref:receptor protein-tyrosine kinase n=1 Tax=Streptomyces venezuelae TaxID=54571 RepID=A0A5P2CV38_STRVZ|nr:Ig-like domain-containing protein [Streptomyces venezuelae]QES46774.1 hypothetical protein DEJ50_01805 [Streptomyces venezuelae]